MGVQVLPRPLPCLSQPAFTALAARLLPPLPWTSPLPRPLPRSPSSHLGPLGFPGAPSLSPHSARPAQSSLTFPPALSHLSPSSSLPPLASSRGSSRPPTISPLAVPVLSSACPLPSPQLRFLSTPSLWPCRALPHSPLQIFTKGALGVAPFPASHPGQDRLASLSSFLPSSPDGSAGTGSYQAPPHPTPPPTTVSLFPAPQASFLLPSQLPTNYIPLLSESPWPSLPSSWPLLPAWRRTALQPEWAAGSDTSHRKPHKPHTGPRVPPRPSWSARAGAERANTKPETRGCLHSGPSTAPEAVPVPARARV